MSKKKNKQKPMDDLNENFDVLDELTEPLDLDGEEEVQADDLVAEKEPMLKKEVPVKRKPRKGLGEELIEVYEAAGDDLSSVTVLDHKHRTWKRMLVWILLFLVAVFVGVAAVSWFIWGGRQAFTGDEVVLEFRAPEEAASGSQIEYTVYYANKEDVSFRQAEVELRFPPGFLFEEADPQPTNATNLWDLGTFAPGQEGEIHVKGTLVGRPDLDTTFSGVFRYSPANFNSEFSEVASTQIMIHPTEADFRLEAPSQILVGQKTSVSVVVTNTSESILKNLRIEPIYPSTFVAESSKPELDEEGHWLISELAQDEEAEFQLDGYFSSAEQEDIELIALLSQQGKEDEYFQQKEAKQEVKLVQGDLLAQLIVNGATKDGSIQWGETLNGTINFRNNSQTNLGDITTVVTIETRYRGTKAETASAGAVDFATLVDSARGSIKQMSASDENTLHKRSVTWTPDDVPLLAQLEPDEEGEINFQVSLLDAQTAIKKIAHPEEVQIVLQVQMVVAKTGDIEEELAVSANPIVLNLNSDLVFDAHARYYADNGEELGYGPLPPKAGEDTVYRVFWNLTNSIHEVDDIVVSAQLPNGVSWKNNYEVSAGEVTFSASSNTITWSLNRLPTDVESADLGFDIVLRPSQTQIGEIASLTKKITMTAKDSVTNGTIIQTVIPLTTAVDRDDKASDKGIVVE